ncbi:MAG: DUF924 family protein [Pseudomonadota bacterium]
MGQRRAQDVLNFWFGADPLAPDQLTQRMRFWFGGDDPPEMRLLRDELIAERFGTMVEAAAAGKLDAWAASPHRLLALILLLDQFPRNVYRGSAKAFAQDDRALSLALAGMQTGADATLTPVHRVFFYMPLQHAESPDIQEESVAAFRSLAEDAPPEHRGIFQACLKFAQLHQRIVARFGRFPHRNQLLGRSSSASELAFLREEAAGFGA